MTSINLVVVEYTPLTTKGTIVVTIMARPCPHCPRDTKRNTLEIQVVEPSGRVKSVFSRAIDSRPLFGRAC
jgi:hypothetical protein